MIKIDTKNETGKIVINDFSKNNFAKNSKQSLECSQIYNFNNNNCILEKGLGIRHLTTYMQNDITSENYELDYHSIGLEHFNKVMYFKQYFAQSNQTAHRLLFHGSDEKLYVFQMFSSMNSLNWTYQLKFSTIPIVLEYKKDGLDSILISANDKLMVWSTGYTPYELTNVPTITSMCVYDDVLYCTIAGESDKIWYTTNLDPESVGTESDVTKYFTLGDNSGDCRKILTFKENLYIFRDYGICRLKTYSKGDPTYNQVYISDAKIYPNTVVVCGDFVVFVTRDGIYKFNGATVSKIDVLHNQLSSSVIEYAVASNLQDNYYLALQLKFDDDSTIGCESETDMKNNALIKLDLNDYSFQIMRGVDIKDMLALKAGIEEKIIVTFNSAHKEKIGEITNDGKCFDEVLPRLYSSNYFIQDDIAGITIRNIAIESSKDIELKIITDENEYSFTTYCDGINDFQTIIPCRKFKVEINSQTQSPYVNCIQCEYVKRK